MFAIFYRNPLHNRTMRYLNVNREEKKKNKIKNELSVSEMRACAHPHAHDSI